MRWEKCYWNDPNLKVPDKKMKRQKTNLYWLYFLTNVNTLDALTSISRPRGMRSVEPPPSSTHRSMENVNSSVASWALVSWFLASTISCRRDSYMSGSKNARSWNPDFRPSKYLITCRFSARGQSSFWKSKTIFCTNSLMYCPSSADLSGTVTINLNT